MTKFKGLLAAGLLLTAASAARAGVSVDIRIGDRPPPPVCGPAYEAVWVPAVTQTTVANVWHEPVTEDRVAQQWVPDQYEWRDVTVPDAYGRPVLTKQNVLVAPGHYQDVHTPIVVRAGYYGPEAQTTVVVPGHWEQRPVLVQGYYPPPPVVYGPPPGYYGPPCGPRFGPPRPYDGPRYDRRDDRWRR